MSSIKWTQQRNCGNNKEHRLMYQEVPPEVQFARHVRTLPNDKIVELRELGFLCTFAENEEELNV